MSIAKNQLIEADDLINNIYPVGSIFLTLNSADYSTYLGKTWVKLPEGKALWTASSGVSITDNNTNLIGAGLPDITGKLQRSVCNNASGSGAFYQINENYPSFGGTGANWRSAWFKASSGETKLDGTLSNDVYGKADTVQPPAYKVYAWKRTS